MNKIGSIALGLLCSANLVFSATAVDISGTVTKTGGGPLKGVKISIAGLKDLSTVTDSLGKFLLGTVGAIRVDMPEVTPYDFTVKNNALVFSSSGKITGEIAVFAGNGKLISSVNFSDLSPVKQSIVLPELAPGLNILRMKLNNATSSCQVLRLGDELYLQQGTSGSRSSSAFLLRKSAAAVKDTLIAQKTGFTDKKVVITSYDTTLTIQMDSIVEAGEIAWGKMENPTAGCNVTGTLPGYSALTANSKLPDPFKKLDGTRIKDKSEWACRRQEIHKSVLHYIYGDKPIPKKGSVTGTVTTSRISVIVNEDGKSCNFSVDVNMNGAKQPAPAIISYGSMGGAPAPSGVAKITLNVTETTGGTGEKSGPFYSFYGKNHPAGYMTAQAWQVSRIIDLLEQNPGIIDPYKIGVTGCSRWGKGAFAAGVLDNRIALTIPVESGIGGAVALRLVEQLGGGEWPYHAISYVRWLSEVALKDFAKANNANGDNTDRLPVDMHSAMALIIPRGLYVVDNPGINNLCPKEAWVTASAAKMTFQAFGLGDNVAYVGTGGTHCDWRSGYTSELNGMIDKFLKGNTSAKTGEMSSSGTKPTVSQYVDWTVPDLPGNL